jgi:5-methylcytosine-specific restriction protein B
MNTADRSVVALDNALRRRFAFKEMMPDLKIINQPENLEVDLKILLQTINGRIERLLDRDHVIGHSYFMGIEKSSKPLNALQAVFANKVLPLLQEYFYSDPAKIGMILGNAFVKVDGDGTPFAPGAWPEDVFENRQTLRFVSPYNLNEADFRSVYEG